MKTWRSTYLALAATTAMIGDLCAQEVTFTSRVDRTNAAVGEHVKLTIELANGQGRFGNPDLGGLVVVAGPFESSSFNYVNGRMSNSVSRTLHLTATSPGDYTIGPAVAQVGGGTIQTEAIKVHFEKGSAPPVDRRLEQAQRADRDLFATITLSKNKAYVGEQVVATYSLYSRYSNLELSNYTLPSLNGFWAEEINSGNTSWEEKLQVINGLQYRVAVLKRQLLFPQKAGVLKIEPITLKCLVDRTFFHRGNTLDVRSNQAELTALELPAGKPPGFNGAVGTLEMKVTAEPTNVLTNDAVDLVIRFSGRGNLKLLAAPTIDFPTDFETYEPKVNDKIGVNASGMSGTREYQYLVIPRHEGEYTLPSVSFHYFDPSTGTYKTLSSAPISFNVGKGSGAGATISRPSKTDVMVLDRDIRFIRTGDLHLREKDQYLFGSWPYVAGLATPAAGFVLLLGWRKRRERLYADVSGRRRRSADRLARQRLKAAREALAANDRTTFYDALGKAVEGYLADKFGLGVAEVNADRIREELGALDNGTIATQAIDLLSSCGMARFAPVEDKPRQQLYDHAVALIGRIEQHLGA